MEQTVPKRPLWGTFRAEKPKVFWAFLGVQTPSAPPLFPCESKTFCGRADAHGQAPRVPQKPPFQATRNARFKGTVFRKRVRISASEKILGFTMSRKSQMAFDLRMTTASQDTAKSRGLADEAIIFGVIADPEPQDSAFDINAEGAMVKADAARPKPAHALELQRRVTRIIIEKAVLLIRQALDRRSQAPVTSPKLRGGEVPQNSVDFPAAWSRRASSASASSFPAFTSRSVWRSHAAASNSANHRRNSSSSSAERPETFFSRASSLLIDETIPLLLSRSNAPPLSSRPPRAPKSSRYWIATATFLGSRERGQIEAPTRPPGR